jgi:DNA replication protein DnaC
VTGVRVDPAVSCEVCHDAGWYRVPVRGGQPWQTELVRCVCQKAADEARTFERLRKLSDFEDEDVAAYTFAGYNGKYNGDAAQAVERWAQDPLGWRDGDAPERPRWLLLWGTPGSGKSHLLRGAWNVLVADGRAPVYAVAPTLLRYVRDGIPGGEYSERFEQVQKAPILLLDDLGVGGSTRWSDEAWFELLNWRYPRRLPTIVATNCVPDDFEPRIASRLQDTRLSAVFAMRGQRR